MLPMMFRLALIRLRAVMLLLAFSLGLAGQAVAGVTMTGQMSAAPGGPVAVMSGGAMGGCSGCDGGNAATSPTCPLAFCWDFVALPAPSLRSSALRPEASVRRDMMLRRASASAPTLTLRALSSPLSTPASRGRLISPVAAQVV